MTHVSRWAIDWAGICTFQVLHWKWPCLSGVSGPSGPSGLSGLSGLSGPSDPSGVSGPSGPSGLSGQVPSPKPKSCPLVGFERNHYG